MPTQRRSQPSRQPAKKTRTSAPPKRAKAATPAKSAKLAKPAKPAKPARSAKPTRPVKSARPAKPVAPSRKAPATPPHRGPAKSPAAKPAAGPSSHDQAVETFERGFQALQQRQFGRASTLLTAVLNNFIDEKELQERARVYLAICERQASREARPRSFEERLNAVTVALNRGLFDESLALLRKLEHEESGNDYVQYLLSVAHAAVGNIAQALAHLRSAIELLPENRFRAALDPALDPLRQDAAFAEMTDASPRRRKLAPSKKR
jgi:tetratricopeptide (TPR) repeat protein